MKIRETQVENILQILVVRIPVSENMLSNPDLVSELD